MSTATEPTPSREPVEVVLWDFGGVFTGSPFHQLGAYASTFGKTAVELADLVLGYDEPDGDHPWHQLERGEIPMVDAVRACGERAAAGGIEGFEIKKFFAAMGGLEGARDAMFDGVARLKEAGVRHAIVSNNLVEVRERWQALVPDGLFEHLVDSSEVGVRKPSPEIYRLALDAMNAVPERTVFVDDHPANVDAARALGMRAVLVGPDQLAALAEVEELVQANAG